MSINLESFSSLPEQKNSQLIRRAFLIHQSIPEFVSSGAPPTTEQELYERVKDKTNAMLFISVVDLVDTGYLLAYQHPDPKFGGHAMYLDLVGVKPEFRKTGVFQSLEDALVKEAKTKGYGTIIVKTWRMREAMQAALTQLGYEQIEIQPRENHQEDRLIYRKLL